MRDPNPPRVRVTVTVERLQPNGDVDPESVHSEGALFHDEPFVNATPDELANVYLRTRFERARARYLAWRAARPNADV